MLSTTVAKSILSASIRFEHDHPSQAGLFGLGKDTAGVHFDARLGVDDDRGGIDAPHRADRLADEIGIARRVDQVEVLSSLVEMDDARLDCVFMMLFFFVEVADAGAVLDAGQAIDRAGAGQDFIDQCGLAGRTVSTENNVANLLD